MNKKGFTLIELLAVIVILAIIALIAVPSVLNIIEDSRKSAAEASARNVASAAKKYYVGSIVKGESVSNAEISDLTINGKRPEKGYVIFNDEGQVNLKIYQDGYCITLNYEGKVTSYKTSSEDCDTENRQIFVNAGKELYYDVTNGKICDEESYNMNDDKMGKSGCLRFFIISEGTVYGKTLILDHNTTSQIDWISLEDYNKANIDNTTCDYKPCTDEGPITALTKLKNDTATWKGTKTPTSYTDLKYGTIDYTGYNARLLTKEEITSITGVSEHDYFDEKCTFANPCSAGDNKYAWLFENTGISSSTTCFRYGCNDFNLSTDTYTCGYWTSTVSTNVWVVNMSGSILYTNPNDTSRDYGIRPVIEI